MSKENDCNVKRSELDENIKVNVVKNIDWSRFKYLIDIDHGWHGRKSFSACDRLKFEERDRGVCYICGSTYPYGSSNKYLVSSGNRNYKQCHLHHRIPNGLNVDGNIFTLCTHCHQMVHQALYISGKWSFARPL